MSMLSRYQKSGGFVQLLQLIETTGKTKQENFLSIIEKEDARWAQALKDKMLTIDKVLSWNDEVLAEVAARLQELTLAMALHGMKPEDGARFLKTFSHTQRRNVEDIKNGKVPTPAEISSAFNKILVEVRNMITNGYIRLEKFAPEMVIPEDFEDELGQAHGKKQEEPSVPNMDSFGSSHSSSGGHSGLKSGVDSHEVNVLRTKLNNITAENNTLKSEVKLLREKLAQIRKIA